MGQRHVHGTGRRHRLAVMAAAAVAAAAVVTGCAGPGPAPAPGIHRTPGTGHHGGSRHRTSFQVASPRRRPPSCAPTSKVSCRAGAPTRPTIGKTGLNGLVGTWIAQNNLNALDFLQDRGRIDVITTAACPGIRQEAVTALEIPDLASGLIGF